MPRPTPKVLTRAPAHTPDAIKEVVACVDDVIAFANQRDTLERAARPLARGLNTLLTAIDAGESCRFSGFPEWAAKGIFCIRSFVRRGHWHLRRCLYCQAWLLAKDARRVLCRRDECVKAAARRRQEVSVSAQAREAGRTRKRRRSKYKLE